MTRRIHMVGCSPRSGTTLLHELMITCFDLQAGADHELSLFVRPKGMTGDYCSKSPSEMIHLARMLPWDKNLFGIYMQRDPRDIVVSRHGRFPDKFWCDYSGWSRNQDLVNKLGTHDRMMVIHYEDLTADPDRAQAAIVEKYGFLKQLHPFSAYPDVAAPSEASLKAMRGVRKISTKSIGSWKTELPRLKQQILAHPGFQADMIRYGYETDDAWMTCLDDVVPDERESVREQDRRDKAPPAALYPLMRVMRRLGTLGQQLRYILTR